MKEFVSHTRSPRRHTLFTIAEPRVSLEDQFAKGGNTDPQEGTKKKQRRDDKNQSARRSRDKNNPAPSRGDQNTEAR